MLVSFRQELNSSDDEGSDSPIRAGGSRLLRVLRAAWLRDDRVL
jgi:hypothetical protein